MKKIVKTIEPKSLTRYRSTIPHENLEDSHIYDDYPNKTKKGKNRLVGIDLLRDIEKEISYNKKSQAIEITSLDDGIIEDIKTLNLNVSCLQKNRKEIYDNVVKNLLQKDWSISRIEKTISFYKEKNSEKFEPFCEMIVYFLIKKLKSKGRKYEKSPFFNENKQKGKE